MPFLVFPPPPAFAKPNARFEYIGWPRKDSVRVRGAWFRHLAPSYAYLLGAADIEGHIRFAQIAVHEALRHLEDYEGPIFFFSVCPRRWISELCNAHRVDLHGLQKLTGQVFAGCSLIGSVDFALFKGFGKGGIRDWHNKVGAHTHGWFGSDLGRLSSLSSRPWETMPLAPKGWHGCRACLSWF